MIFSSMWEENLEHFKAVCKWLEAVDLKIKQSKYKFFKTKVHFLGFLIGINSIQPLPEQVAAIQALLPLKNIDELGQFLGLVGFYRKFIPFFPDITVCLNKMLRKGATFNWTEQCENAFKLLKKDLTMMPAIQFPNQINHFNYLQMHPNIAIPEFLTRQRKDN